MNKKSFTMADRRSSRFHISNIQRKAVAFTMAEILLSLTIIGVVAAITLPSLTGNINEKTWNTQRKALYARMSQAIALIPYINGYGIGETDAQTISATAKSFVTTGLSKVLKINNICDYNHLQDCGIASKLSTIKGSKIDFPKRWTSLTSSMSSYAKNSYVAAFETANGESIAVFYNPLCKSLNKENIQSKEADDYSFFFASICLNFIYDLNGVKGPNMIGKDMGVITAISPTDSSVVAPIANPSRIIGSASEVRNTASEMHLCKNNDSRLPNLEEFVSLSINNALFGFNVSTGGNTYWIAGDGRYYYGSPLLGRVAACKAPTLTSLDCRSAIAKIHCIER